MSTTKLSINELADMNSFLAWLIMSTISANDKETKAKFERILGVAGTIEGDMNTPRYEVDLIINGEHFDIRAVSKLLRDQHHQLVTERAGEIIKEKLGDSFFEMSEKVQSTVDELVRGMREKAAEMLGYNPWERDR